jgi:hypothetical protein
VAQRIGHGAGHVRRRVDEGPFDSVGLRLFDDFLDAAACAVAQLRLGRAAQLVPQADRALRVAINQHATARRPVGMRGEMRGQSALAGTALARGEDDDIHARDPDSRDLVESSMPIDSALRS